ncbi:helix-turn-helix transcriptional regulator [Alkalibacter saccharofermentans]|uniref:DNA-binding transcriptional regulator, XRE-family HTH domain n=1 Tax=Alkalibacter saccharofermentans DSM 14828 TaxID=1120975 RepID=A0A1M4ZII5_9FIRM|nr:helix-turn-helix transcriptional regulator [Alkalibacter saccharofermentans]SHF17870.1 DNA-binding transcriptional regulator, XRE-family HTH domain [Alkalibacter saccharofermentans DSM 14828]
MIKERLKELRENRKISQAELGKEVGVSGAYIQQLEKGVKKNPSLEVVLKLASFFQDDFYYLIGAKQNIDTFMLDINAINDYAHRYDIDYNKFLNLTTENDVYESEPNIKRLRMSLGMSAEEFADAIEIKPEDLYFYELGALAPLHVYIKMAIILNVPLIEVIEHTSYMRIIGGYSIFFFDSLEGFQSEFKGKLDKETYEEVLRFMKKHESLLQQRRKNINHQEINQAMHDLKSIYVYLGCVEEVSSEVLLEIIQGEDTKHLLAYLYDKYRYKKDFSEIKSVRWVPFHAKEEKEDNNN